MIVEPSFNLFPFGLNKHCCKHGWNGKSDTKAKKATIWDFKWQNLYRKVWFHPLPSCVTFPQRKTSRILEGINRGYSNNELAASWSLCSYSIVLLMFPGMAHMFAYHFDQRMWVGNFPVWEMSHHDKRKVPEEWGGKSWEADLLKCQLPFAANTIKLLMDRCTSSTVCYNSLKLRCSFNTHSENISSFIQSRYFTSYCCNC